MGRTTSIMFRITWSGTISARRAPMEEPMIAATAEQAAMAALPFR